jgi:small subunit ribosomal protein S16
MSSSRKKHGKAKAPRQKPLTSPPQVLLKHDRVQYWSGVGAQMSDTVKRLLKNNPAPEPQTAA